mgnify:CR=1 FL=1
MTGGLRRAGPRAQPSAQVRPGMQRIMRVLRDLWRMLSRHVSAPRLVENALPTWLINILMKPKKTWSLSHLSGMPNVDGETLHITD